MSISDRRIFEIMERLNARREKYRREAKTLKETEHDGVDTKFAEGYAAGFEEAYCMLGFNLIKKKRIRS